MNTPFYDTTVVPSQMGCSFERLFGCEDVKFITAFPPQSKRAVTRVARRRRIVTTSQWKEESRKNARKRKKVFVLFRFGIVDHRLAIPSVLTKCHPWKFGSFGFFGGIGQ